MVSDSVVVDFVGFVGLDVGVSGVVSESVVVDFVGLDVGVFGVV